MSRMETYRVRVSTGSTPSTVLYVQDTRTEDSSSLALPTYRRRVWGMSGAWSAGSRGREQYRGRIEAV
jgi:hypothetical protein